VHKALVYRNANGNPVAPHDLGGFHVIPRSELWLQGRSALEPGTDQTLVDEGPKRLQDAAGWRRRGGLALLTTWRNPAMRSAP
jgi:hypothetical protein